MNKDIIEIDIKDWRKTLENEILRDEKVSFDSRSELIEGLITHYGYTSTQAGHIAIAAKQVGLIKDDKIWPDHKVTLGKGGAALSMGAIRSAVTEKQLKNGKIVRSRKYIGLVEEEETEEGEELESSQENDVTHNAYVASDSEEGIQRSINYLLNTVPAHIRARFNELAGNEELKPIAEELKQIIDEMVEEFE